MIFLRLIKTYFFSGLLLSLPLIAAPLKQPPSERALIRSINSTGIFVYYLLDKSHNTIISPLSLSASLLMAYMGAREETEREMARAMHLSMPQKDVGKIFASLHDQLTSRQEMINLGNSMWVGNKTKILSSYRNTIEDDFSGTIKKVDFDKPKKTAHEINQWIFDQTQGKIGLFVQPSDIPLSTKLALVNSLYVKGSWENPFPTQKTEEKHFHTSMGRWVSAKMMNQQAYFPYFENEKTQMLVLPFEETNPHLGLVIFLPKKHQSNLFDFYYAQESSKPDGFFSYLDHLEKRYIDVSIPKFTASQKLNTLSLLNSLGIHLALSNKANFSGIDKAQDLMISKAFHQSVISIDEGGLFAAAGSGVTFSLKSGAELETPILFQANRSFLYALVDLQTKLLLFIGECIDPTQIEIKQVEGAKNS
jgi:serine protease inhibitor